MFVVFAKARNPSDSSKRNEEKKLDFTSDRGLNTGEVGFLHQSPAQRSQPAFAKTEQNIEKTHREPWRGRIFQARIIEMMNFSFLMMMAMATFDLSDSGEQLENSTAERKANGNTAPLL